MRWEKCALCNKRFSEGKCSFFKVPKDKFKLQRWNERCSMSFKANAVICENHFTTNDFIQPPGDPSKKARLQPGAVPLLPNKDHQEAAAVCSIEAPAAYSMEAPAYSFGATACSLKVDAILPMEVLAEASYMNCSTQTDNDFIENKAILEVISLKKKNQKLEKELQKYKNIKNNLSNFLTDGQIRKVMNPDSKMHWARSDIPNAICLHAAGSRAYRHLYNKGFPLPHKSTLQRWARKIDIEEGIINFCIDSMKLNSSLPADEKICVLSFDEMKLCVTYEYDQSLNLVREPVNYVQVAMARGLKKSWKQPIFYGFDCKMTKSVVIEIISALYDATYTVVAIVSNMSAANQSLWRELGVSAEKPWFDSPNRADDKIFAFADVPHLLKRVRSRFIDTGFVWNDIILKSETIKELIDNVSSSDLTVVHKLTMDHLLVGNGGSGRQKVKLAAQLFSNTTAKAIRCYSVGRELCQPLETADFIQLINDWFDIFNSKLKTMGFPGKKPYGKDLAHQNGILEKVDSFMANPIIPKKQLTENASCSQNANMTKQSLAPFQKGILMSNNALREMYIYVKKRYNIDYILTHRLNQNALENFFSAIQSKGGPNDHPSPKDFKYRLRKYVLGSY